MSPVRIHRETESEKSPTKIINVSIQQTQAHTNTVLIRADTMMSSTGVRGGVYNNANTRNLKYCDIRLTVPFKKTNPLLTFLIGMPLFHCNINIRFVKQHCLLIQAT